MEFWVKLRNEFLEYEVCPYIMCARFWRYSYAVFAVDVLAHVWWIYDELQCQGMGERLQRTSPAISQGM
jgi:hypothetical protein